MANAKISDVGVFITGASNPDYNDITNINGLAGWSNFTGVNQNVAISGTQLVTSLETNLYSSTPLPVSKGGTGNSSFATGFVKASGTSNFGVQASIDLASDVGTSVLPIANGGTGSATLPSTITNSTVNYASDGTGILPITKGGTGYNNSYKSVQVFVWPNGSPVAYNNVPNATPTKIPFDTTAIISTIQPSTLANAQWTCVNSGAGFPGTFATFTLGTAGAGLWKVRVAQHWFDQTNNVEVRASFVINGGTPIDVVDEKSTELTGDKIFYGELIQEFSASDTLELEMEFNGGGVTPFPSAAGQRPPEISFERLI